MNKSIEKCKRYIKIINKRFTKTGQYTNYELNKIGELYQAIDKLGELENLEQELGIDLITLLKVLKNGFYVANDKYNTDKCFGALAYNFDHCELEKNKK